MRIAALLIGTSMLAACSGAGPETISANPAPTTGGGGTTGGGTASAHTFVNPTETKTYKGLGVAHGFDYTVVTDNLSGQLISRTEKYASDATTVRDSAMSITYNPRDAIFDLAITGGDSGVSFSSRFQDPAHRTAFGGSVEPQYSTPRLSSAGIQYLEFADALADGSNSLKLIANSLQGNKTPSIPPTVNRNESASYNQNTFFYQKPGTSTKYVTFAGFLKNSITQSLEEKVAIPDVAATPTTAFIPGSPASSKTTAKYGLSRGLFVFGENTSVNLVPKTGAGTFTGTMLASMVFNDQIDTSSATAPTYFQWIEGTATGNFNFAANTFTLGLAGNVFDPQLDGISGSNYSIKGGATFSAQGTGQIDLVKTGGFIGAFNSAWFVNPDTTRFDLVIAGSGIDGAFYGPGGEEVGGNFQIVGGKPDERIDILGVFTGKK